MKEALQIVIVVAGLIFLLAIILTEVFIKTEPPQNHCINGVIHEKHKDENFMRITSVKCVKNLSFEDVLGNY